MEVTQADEVAKLTVELAAKRTSLGLPSNGDSPLARKVGPKIEDQQRINEERIRRREAEQRERDEQYRRRRAEYVAQAPIRKRDKVLAQLVAASGARYAKATFENYAATTPEQKAVKKAVMDFAGKIGERIEAGNNVLFIGPPGTGKDHLLFALCKAAAAALKTVIWANGSDLWLKFREAIGKEEPRSRRHRPIDGCDDDFDATIGGTEREIIDQLFGVDVLAISDPFPPGCGLTDFQAGNIAAVIDRRYSDLRPTWLTMNVANRAEAKSRLGGSVVDRLGHAALVVACDWPSYRQKQEQVQ